MAKKKDKEDYTMAGAHGGAGGALAPPFFQDEKVQAWVPLWVASADRVLYAKRDLSRTKNHHAHSRVIYR